MSSYKKQKNFKDQPTPLLIIVSSIPFFLLAFLLLWFVFSKSSKYQETQKPDYSAYYNNAYQSNYPSADQQYSQSLQAMKSQESSSRQQERMDFNRTNLQMKDQLQDLRRQTDLSRNQKFAY